MNCDTDTGCYNFNFSNIFTWTDFNRKRYVFPWGFQCRYDSNRQNNLFVIITPAFIQKSKNITLVQINYTGYLEFW